MGVCVCMYNKDGDCIMSWEIVKLGTCVGIKKQQELVESRVLCLVNFFGISLTQSSVFVQVT